MSADPGFMDGPLPQLMSCLLPLPAEGKLLQNFSTCWEYSNRAHIYIHTHTPPTYLKPGDRILLITVNTLYRDIHSETKAPLDIMLLSSDLL